MGYSVFRNLKGATGVELNLIIVVVLGVISCAFFGCCAEHYVVWLVIFA